MNTANINWVVVGGSVLVIAALAAVILVLLVMIGSQSRTVNATATAQVINQRATDTAATRTAQPTETVLPTRTPFATQSALVGVPPTGIVIGGSAGSNTVDTTKGGVAAGFSPQATVEEYFNLVTRNQNDSWSILTDRFKQKYNCCAPNYDFAGYTSWWSSVQRVSLSDVRLVAESGNWAVVHAIPTYTMRAGGSSVDVSEPYFLLLYNPASEQWKFDDRGDDPNVLLPTR